MKSSSSDKPLVSLVLPAFNEAAILEKNLNKLCQYMATLENEYRWEAIIINDGSDDDTADIAEAFAKSRDNVRVYHHITNFGLGQAFKFAFGRSKGDYVITLDIDLSYTEDHIERLLKKIRETKSKIVLASPYMKGGTIGHVPGIRRFLSIAANRFLSIFAQGHLSTLTCMVRAYDGPYIRALNLRSTGMDVMPETVYKSMILRARIEQIPAHLDWGPQEKGKTKRTSSLRVIRQIFTTLLSGFIFRPFVFFIFPGLALLVFAAYTNIWMVIHFFEKYFALPASQTSDKVSAAVAAAYAQYPYTFIVGLLSLMLAIQLISLGILAMQNKNYFEELFYLNSTIHQHNKYKDEGIG